MGTSAVFSLNAHASYACRHSGACCTAGWSIPVEPRIESLVGTTWLLPGPDGACPQFDRHSRLCRLHQEHGELALPDSCYQFPRRALVDQRGTFVTLSHYCPTAAALLLDDTRPLRIVEGPPAFPTARKYEGLDARDEWPPLLRRDVLFDYESFGRWERYLVDTLATSTDTTAATLEMLADCAERLRGWSIDAGSMSSWTMRVLSSDAPDRSVVNHHRADRSERYAPFAGPDAFNAIAAMVPEGLDAPVLPDRFAEQDRQWVEPAWHALGPLVRRYLAAKAFGSWTAYQARGVRAQIAELFASATVLRVECVRACQQAQAALNRDTLLEAVRRSDLLLVHLADRDALSEWFGKAEADAAVVER